MRMDKSEALEAYKAVVKELDENKIAMENLQAKKIKLSEEIRQTEALLVKSKRELEGQITQNLKGLLSDEDLVESHKNITDIEESLKLLIEKSKMIAKVEGDFSSESGQIIMNKQQKRMKYLRAYVEDLLKAIPDDVKNLLAEAWSIYSRGPNSGYQAFLNDVFPPEEINEKNLRWDQFVEAQGIEH